MKRKALLANVASLFVTYSYVTQELGIYFKYVGSSKLFKVSAEVKVLPDEVRETVNFKHINLLASMIEGIPVQEVPRISDDYSFWAVVHATQSNQVRVAVTTNSVAENTFARGIDEYDVSTYKEQFFDSATNAIEFVLSSILGYAKMRDGVSMKKQIAAAEKNRPAKSRYPVPVHIRIAVFSVIALAIWFLF